jgi:uncharacterized membrane protein YjdF
LAELLSKISRSGGFLPWMTHVRQLATYLGDSATDSLGLRAFFPGMASALFHDRRVTMLFTIAVILLVLWLLGLVSGYTLGNFIYVLLVIALVLFVVGLVSGRRVV